MSVGPISQKPIRDAAPKMGKTVAPRGENWKLMKIRIEGKQKSAKIKFTDGPLKGKTCWIGIASKSLKWGLATINAKSANKQLVETLDTISKIIEIDLAKELKKHTFKKIQVSFGSRSSVKAKIVDKKGEEINTVKLTKDIRQSLRKIHDGNKKKASQLTKNIRQSLQKTYNKLNLKGRVSKLSGKLLGDKSFKIRSDTLNVIKNAGKVYEYFAVEGFDIDKKSGLVTIPKSIISGVVMLNTLINSIHDIKDVKKALYSIISGTKKEITVAKLAGRIYIALADVSSLTVSILQVTKLVTWASLGSVIEIIRLPFTMRKIYRTIKITYKTHKLFGKKMQLTSVFTGAEKMARGKKLESAFKHLYKPVEIELENTSTPKVEENIKRQENIATLTKLVGKKKMKELADAYKKWQTLETKESKIEAANKLKSIQRWARFEQSIDIIESSLKVASIIGLFSGVCPQLAVIGPFITPVTKGGVTRIVKLSIATYKFRKLFD